MIYNRLQTGAESKL